MADSLAMRAALDQASVLDLAAGIQAPRALPALLLRVPDLVEGQPAWGQVHLLRVRENGFMIIAPDEAAIVARMGPKWLFSTMALSRWYPHAVGPWVL